jgi:vesicle-fusing ATPase
MTNRKDIIDPAILRPGRLEVHIEIPLPDRPGREQILRIKTAKMAQTQTITLECLERIPELAGMIENFTGAEIEAFVESASKYVLSRNIDGSKAGAKADQLDDVVQWGDFERALSNADVQPQFGNKTELNLPQYFRNGIVDYGATHAQLNGTLERLLNQVRLSSRTPIMSVLLEGPTQTGKTALAAHVAHASGFPYVRLISADQYIGMAESQKCEKIYNTFMDAYKSPLSLVVIDDIERIIEYVPVGPRFSAAVLQTLLVMIKKAPTVATSRIFIVATTAVSHLIEDLGLVKAFSVSLQVPMLTDKGEISKVLQESGANLSNAEISSITSAIKEPVGIKQLLDVIEMARSEAQRSGGEGASISPVTFLECLTVRGL